MPPNPHVPQPAPLAPALPAPSADAPAWETLELARHSAEAHATFQRLMTEAHLEYLRVIEALTGRPSEPDRPGPAPRTGNAATGRWAGDPANQNLNRRVWPADRRSPATLPAETAVEAGALPSTVPAQPDRHGTAGEAGQDTDTDAHTEATPDAVDQPDVAGQREEVTQDAGLGLGAEFGQRLDAAPSTDHHRPSTDSDELTHRPADPAPVPILPTYPSLRAGSPTATPRTAISALDLIAPAKPATERTQDNHTPLTIHRPEQHTATPADPHTVDPSPADPDQTAGTPASSTPASSTPASSTPASDISAISADAGPADVDVVRLTMSWARTPLGGLAPPGLHAGPVHVVDGGSGLGAAVAAELTARGLAAEVATHPGLGGVIFLGGLARPVSTDEAIEAQLTALWLARNGKDRGIFVTVADTQTGRAGPWLGGLVGLVGAVGRERPSASAIAIECERGDRDPATVAVLIADELTRGAGAQRVRVAADGTRSVGRLVSAGPGAPRERAIGAESVIVASGEARGFCGAALIELARSTRCRLVLVGPAPLAVEPEHLAGAADEVSLMRKFAAGTGGPDGLAGMRTRARAVLAAREIRATIAACVAAGAETRYVHADHRDADRLTAELDQIRSEWGPITGVLHCAEVTADRRPGEKSAADADRSLSTHLAGLPALLTATVQDPLDTLMLFSSVAGWPGELAQGTQALIGATLDRIAEAEQRRRPSCLVRSLAWDPADGETLPVRARAAAFVAELALDGPAHVVLAPRSTTPDRAQPASVAVDASTHPWLADHRPQDVAILPLAAGLGWMAAAARVREQDAVLTGVRVLRSVSTEHPQKLGVTVFGREVWLSNDAGEPCFRSSFGPPGHDRQWRPTGDPARFPGSSVYAGRPLFHGPRLHVVRSLGEIGPDGVVGTVLGARAMGWPDDDLPVDLAALDGALQLSGVWAMDEHRPVLPMGVAECRIHRWGRLPGPALCIVADGDRDDVGARCDAALVGPDGELWVELLGIEFVAPLSPR